MEDASRLAISIVIQSFPVGAIPLNLAPQTPIEVITPAVGRAVRTEPILGQAVGGVLSLGEAAQSVGMEVLQPARFITHALAGEHRARSEERRVGKECRSRWS